MSYSEPMKLPGFLQSKSSMAEAAYNLGLNAKYEGKWRESLVQNRLADQLRPDDEATLWNLGIAATALHEWDDARRAWRAYGIAVNDGPGEVLINEISGCVRINPKGAAEVVWGMRIDPARIRVTNVPMPASERRYGDIILNDGAPEGTRVSNGIEYPVFDELAVWKGSAYSTFEVELVVPSVTAMESLEDKCQDKGLWVENWGTIRMLCEACSRGTPGEHTCANDEAAHPRYGFAARSEAAVRNVLDDCRELEGGCEVGSIKLVVHGVTG